MSKYQKSKSYCITPKKLRDISRRLKKLEKRAAKGVMIYAPQQVKVKKHGKTG